MSLRHLSGFYPVAMRTPDLSYTDHHLALEQKVLTEGDVEREAQRGKRHLEPSGLLPLDLWSPEGPAALLP